MKKLVLLLCLIFSSSLFAQNWQWAKSAGSTSIDILQDICTDNNGNTYAIGQFGFVSPSTAYMIFDTDTVWNNGVNQIFVAKYSNNGNIVWAEGIGGNNSPVGISCSNCEYANRIFFDSISNSLYVTGTIYSVANFGSTVLSGTDDLFLTRLDLDGKFIWANLITSNQHVSNRAITTDLSGNIYLGGYCTDSILFGANKIKPGGFIAKYDSSGNFAWSKQKFTNSSAVEIKILENDIFIFGSITNDTAKIDTSEYISSLSSNMFFAKFDSNAVIKWIKYPLSSGLIAGNDMDMDSQGNFYITGGFQNDINFNGALLTNTNIDMFLFKFDKNGNVIWKKQANSTNSAIGANLVTSPQNTLYIQGILNGGATFDFGSINSISNNSLFFIGIDSLGHILGADQLIGFSRTQITSNNSGGFLLGGDFTTNFANPTLTIGNTTLSSIYASDIFIAKHDAITGIKGPTSFTNKQLYIHANPNEGKCNITVPDEFLHEKNLVLSIYNSSGKLIQQQNLEMNDGKIKLSLEAEAKGLYNAVLSNGTKSYSGKIVFE